MYLIKAITHYVATRNNLNVCFNLKFSILNVYPSILLHFILGCDQRSRYLNETADCWLMNELPVSKGITEKTPQIIYCLFWMSWPLLQRCVNNLVKFQTIQIDFVAMCAINDVVYNTIKISTQTTGNQVRMN